MKYYLAIDIGASSGRHIVGHSEDGQIITDEVYRFHNGVTEKDGHLTWNIAALLADIKEGIRRAQERYAVESLSIDTWGVDYVLMKGDGEILPCYAYRDSRTEEPIKRVHEIIPFDELYLRTGTQFQSFNSIYQLYADKLAGRLEGVTDWLMMPEYFMYKLCGNKAREYTDATTSGLINAETGCFDRYITDKLGLDPALFPGLSQPGTVIGEYNGIKVVLCATHDTGSAVEGIPMKTDAPYISSGTWSLLGVRTPKPVTKERSGSWSNEGGVGYNRYQKNIMGLWLINELRRELCPGKSFQTIMEEAMADGYDGIADVNAQSFLAPASMKAAFDAALSAKPQRESSYFRCAYRSLAECYARSVDELEATLEKKYDTIYIVGGGAKDEFLNLATAEATGRTVKALPIEATALGNLRVQMEADR